MHCSYLINYSHIAKYKIKTNTQEDNKKCSSYLINYSHIAKYKIKTNTQEENKKCSVLT